MLDNQLFELSKCFTMYVHTVWQLSCTLALTAHWLSLYFSFCYINSFQRRTRKYILHVKNYLSCFGIYFLNTLSENFLSHEKYFFFPLKVLSFDCFSSQKGLHGSLGSDFVYLDELDQSSLPTLFSLFPLIRIKLPTLYLQKFPLGPKLVY